MKCENYKFSLLIGNDTCRIMVGCRLCCFVLCGVLWCGVRVRVVCVYTRVCDCVWCVVLWCVYVVVCCVVVLLCVFSGV